MAETLYRRKDDPEAALAAIMKEPRQMALFNKVSGEFTGLASASTKPYLNGDLYKWKEIDIDVNTQKWDGNYDTGKVINLDSAPVEVKESDMDRRAGEAIQWVYNWYQQMNAIIPVLLAVIEKTEVTGPEVDAFLDLAEFIEEKRALNDRYKKAYNEGPDWKYITKDEERAILSRQLEGGIHEILGPKSGIAPPTQITGP